MNDTAALQTDSDSSKIDMDIDLSAMRSTMASRSPPDLPVVLEWSDLNYFIYNEDGTTRTLLHNLSGIARPGELTIVMGPTGSGKTTLLTCLSRRIKKDVSGEIRVNGTPPTKDYKRQVAFVLQDDVLYAGLTTRQTLLYTALLRLGGNLSRKEVEAKVDDTIDCLGLTKAKDTFIGGPLFRGVSGGERKRINIGNEILTKPSLILLDEPTSGLDTSTALQLLQMLKGMAESGLTIVATIHQPSSPMWKLFDNLLLLVDGHSIYFGKADQAVPYLASIGLKCEQFWNPADFIMGLILSEEVSKQAGQSMKDLLVKSWEKYHANHAGPLTTAADVKLIERSRKTQEGVGTPSYSLNFFGQVWVLCQRCWILGLGKLFDIYSWIQTFLLAFLIGIIWFQIPYQTDYFPELTACVFFIFNYISGFHPAFEILFSLPIDRAVVVRERASGSYRLSAYYVAKLLTEIPYYFPTSLVFIIITYWMTGLHKAPGPFFVFFFINILTIFVSASLGLLISAVTLPNTQASLTLLTISLMAIYVLGGFFIQKYPSWLEWFPYLSFFKYAYNCLVINQFVGTEYFIVDNGTVTNETIAGEVFMQSLLIGFPDQIWQNALILLGMGIGFRTLGFFALMWSITRGNRTLVEDLVFWFKRKCFKPKRPNIDD